VLHIVASVVVPIVWGAAVHWLFDTWAERRRGRLSVAQEDAVDEQALR
jgi:hypothetical protein